MIDAVIVRENAVSAWETYERTFEPGQFGGYTHKKRAMGGNYRASFTLHGDLTELTTFFESALGRHVEAWNHRGQGVWDGIIFELELALGGFSKKITLSALANEIWMRYYNGAATVRSTAQTDAVSIARYGTRQLILSGGKTTSALADQGCLTHLNISKDPSVPTLRWTGPVSSEATLFVDCRGYWDTLFWQAYNQTAVSGAVDASTVVASVITAKGEFIDSTDIETNSTQIEREIDSDTWAGDFIQAIARYGDSEYNRWVCGVGWGRRFYYRQAARSELPS